MPSHFNRKPSRPRKNPIPSGKAALWLLAGLVAMAAAGGAWWQWRPRASDPGAAGASAPGAGGPGAAGGGRRFGGGAGGVQPVSVRPARQQDVRVMVNAIGSLTASNTAVVRAQVSGVLQRIQFQEGQQVKAGQLLAQIDPRAFAASASQAEGALARDSAQLENAKVDLARYKDLLAKDAAPKQQLDTQAALVRQLEGTVKVDQGALDSAKLQLSYTQVLAPISGRVGLKQVDLGNVVQPSDANGLVSIAQTRPIALVFAIPASQVPLLQALLAAKQVLPVQAWDKSGTRQLATGRVATIDNAIDAATDTIKVKALFPNIDDALFPNQSVGVRLQLDTLKDVLAVPQAAVLRGTQGFYVYVVEADNTVSTRVVKPGAVDGEWMAVEGAVQPDEKVVIDGVDRLRNGAKVEVIVPNARGGNSGGGAGKWNSKADGKSGSASEPASAASGAAKAASAAGKSESGKPAAGDIGKPGTAPDGAAKQSANTPTRQAPAAAEGAAPDAAANDRRAFFQSLSQEERDKLRAMDPDERRALIEKLRAQKSGGKASAN
ncbi:MAG: efflux RND transporter periplasmic adaptor subunit [Rhodoferax sp.]|nr:efflux RND transporter periplasmic adaptor subunit [Rhodoferax sp.]